MDKSEIPKISAFYGCCNLPLLIKNNFSFTIWWTLTRKEEYARDGESKWTQTGVTCKEKRRKGGLANNQEGNDTS